MRNMDLSKTPMGEQEATKRRRNFEEVSLGYTPEEAILEANRCLQCKDKPCVAGCPVSIEIPAFVEKITEQKFDDAYDVLTEQNTLPAVCGRVCPQESQCESKCIRGIKGEPVAIGRLERFVADYHREHGQETPSKEQELKEKEACVKASIAVVGSGPSGLACAGELVKKGYQVTIFEALHTAGGVLVYGIPEFRLPKKIVEQEIDTLIQQGAVLETNVLVGKTLTIEDLFSNGFEAVFIGTGAGLPVFMNIAGENLKGVYSANEYLTRINLMKAYLPSSSTPIYRAKKVAVVGGGNVAMDAARSALRLGAEQVHLVYRRSEKEMPARFEEIEHAKQEGVHLATLTNPIEILGDENNWVKSIKCVKMVLGEADASGRKRPIAEPNSEFLLDVDCVVMAIGTKPNPLLSETVEELAVNERGCIVTQDETGRTTKQAVYAGGDAVTGAATVILAMGAGKNAAIAIDEYLNSR